jgi:putative tryptophan/tyrosine transport system substrate-binding protein
LLPASVAQGGNVTGVSVFSAELAPKRLQLLRELVPKVGKIAVLTNPATMDDAEAMKRAGLPLLTITAEAESDFEPAFIQAAQQGVEALLVTADPFFNSPRAQIVALAARHSLPAAYPFREYVEAGGLMSYGTSLAGTYRQVGQYVSRVLKGDKPADLPVQNPIKFDLAVNLKTARALGITIPETLLATADEVIE